MRQICQFSLLLLIFIVGSFSQATVTVINVPKTRASVVDHDTTANTLIVYGGTSGECDITDLTTSKYCDSCDGSLAVCNTTRIHSDLRLRIEFTDSANAGYPVMIYDNNLLTLTGDTQTTSVAAGETAVIEVEWRAICNALGVGSCGATELLGASSQSGTFTIGLGDTASDTTPTDSFQFTIKVHDPIVEDAAGINTPQGADSAERCDSTNVPVTGTCDFFAYPGDGKVYIDEADYGAGFPNSGSIPFTAVRVFYAAEPDNGFDDINNASLSQDISIESDSSGYFLSGNIIDGLNNGTAYYFRIAVVDEANNVSYITDDQAILDECGGATPAVGDSCDYRATPDPVEGLLPEDLNCFIATAAFGSPFRDQVKTFRRFRDEILSTSALGNELVQIYYRVSPQLAGFIEKSENLKQISRLLLAPFWAFASLSLKIGIFLTTILSTVLLMFPLLIYRWHSYNKLAKARVQ